MSSDAGTYGVFFRDRFEPLFGGLLDRGARKSKPMSEPTSSPSQAGRARAGVVYLVGAGPGDASLITERAAELLASADVILHDELVAPSLLRRARVDAEITYVGKRGTGAPDRQHKQSEIDARLVALARAGKSVVRLKGGDPYLFGRGSEEAEVLADAHIPFEVVPGVTSPLAAAAYAGISLTHRDWASSVTFVSATSREGDVFDFEELRGVRGTICVLMGWKRLEAVTASLIDRAQRSPRTPAAMIERAATAEQRVVTGELQDIARKVRDAGLGTPSILIVGEVVQLRDRLRWFDAWPLFGKRILVTRAEHQAEAAAGLLRRRGALPIEIATITIGPSPDPELVRRSIGELKTCDVVAFTSENGVSAFFATIRQEKRDARVFGGARVAAIGSGTARALEAQGIRADIVPPTFRGEALAEAILRDVRERGLDPKGQRVIIPRALVAREALPEALRAAGMHVDIVPVYETQAVDAEHRQRLVEAFEKGAIDVALITSPSTVENLMALLGENASKLLKQVTLASIGGVTSDAASRLGLEVAVTATTSTLPGLVEALEGHFQTR